MFKSMFFPTIIHYCTVQKAYVLRMKSFSKVVVAQKHIETYLYTYVVVCFLLLLYFVFVFLCKSLMAVELNWMMVVIFVVLCSSAYKFMFIFVL